MCACSWDFVCSRCVGTLADWREWQVDEAAVVEQDRREVRTPDYARAEVKT